MPLVQGPPRQEAPIVVAGASGVLSSSQSEATVERAVAAAPDPDAMRSLVAMMESLSDDPLYKDNDVGLLVDGPATYTAMLEAVHRAEREIDVEMYIIGDDRIGELFRDALIQRAEAGVAVHLLYDSVGSWGVSSDFFDAMRSAGVEVIEFNPASPLHGG
ncbi:MAG TPA: cardiolipin synthase B, partial [Pseudomonadales bacterium]|nr:cardiolipin synthase B [Pseudomonadales bacterium]